MDHIKWRFLETRMGVPTVQVEVEGHSFLLHSKYDPLTEAKRWVEQLEIEQNSVPTRIVILGMGAGYHIQALHQKYPNTEIVVWEMNNEYALWIRESQVLSWLPNVKDRITYYSTDSKKEIVELFSPLIQQNEQSYFYIYPPALRLISNRLKDIRDLFENHILYIRTVRAQKGLLLQNFNDNLCLSDPGIREWIQYFSEKPMILVSAGPSLTKQLSLLKEIRSSNHLVVGCVGTALKPLLLEGITPDFVMLSDPKLNIYEQIEAIDTGEIPLFYLSTANSHTIKSYTGPRYIVWQKGYPIAGEQANAKNEPAVHTGGSVATCLLDLMIQMGASSIALIGQDLAYTNGRSHAANTHAVSDISVDTGLLEIPDFYQKSTVYTSLNLHSYLKWFERYIRDSSNHKRKKVEFWNCTEGGAYISGWRHGKLREYIKTRNICIVD